MSTKPHAASDREKPSPDPPPPGRGTQRDAASFELVVRLQPFGPTIGLKVTGDTPISQVKSESFQKFALPAEEMPNYVLALEGRHRLDESKSVGEERLWDLAFIQLGRPAEVGLDDTAGGW